MKELLITIAQGLVEDPSAVTVEQDESHVPCCRPPQQFFRFLTFQHRQFRRVHAADLYFPLHEKALRIVLVFGAVSISVALAFDTLFSNNWTACHLGRSPI